MDEAAGESAAELGSGRRSAASLKKRREITLPAGRPYAQLS